MTEKSALAVTVGLADHIATVERELRTLGYTEVEAKPEDLADRQYSKRQLLDPFDSVTRPNPSIVITWRT